MPLSFFRHDAWAHFREVAGISDPFEHTFGGDPSSFGIRFVNCEPIHLIYRLNQADPAVRLGISGLNWLPLCYHFSYASFEGELIYRVLNDTEIELIAPTDAPFDVDFPYPNYPRLFPESLISFRRQKYDPTVAEDALQLAAVFGVEQLSESEMKQAITVAEERSKTISDCQLPDWSAEDTVRYNHRQPFMQGAPLKSCGNPACTAEIAYRAEELTIPMDENFEKLTSKSSLTIEAHDVRRDSMRVFALYQPNEGDNMMWGDPYYQLIFEVCECCNCIRVSNQCT